MFNLFKGKDTPLSDRTFGNIGNNGPSASLLQQLENVREKINKTSSLAVEYKKKLNELTSFNEELTYGYINNLNVIVDISAVLNEYKMLMTSVLEQLHKFDSAVAEDFQKINIDHIRQLTSDQLSKVERFFNGKDFSNLKETILLQGNTEAANKISKVKDNFLSLSNKSRNTVAVLSQQPQQGGKRKTPTNKLKKKTALSKK